MPRLDLLVERDAREGHPPVKMNLTVSPQQLKQNCNK
jgi:hypothetical protein